MYTEMTTSTERTQKQLASLAHHLALLGESTDSQAAQVDTERTQPEVCTPVGVNLVE